jgi:hypothetical protein
MTAPPFVFDVRSQVANHTYKCMFPNNLFYGAGSKQGEKSKPSFDHDQDKELQSRILNLNSQIKILNRGLGRIAPAFNQDVYKSTKRFMYS